MAPLFSAPEDADGRVTAHPQSHQDFLAKIQSSTRVLISPNAQEMRERDSYSAVSYPSDTPHHQSMSQPFHLPSRTLVSPSPAPVPIDNFAAPRSDSPYGDRSGARHRRGQSSGQNQYSQDPHFDEQPQRWEGVTPTGPVRLSDGDSLQRSMTGESRHRFTIGDTYEYNEYDDAVGGGRRGVGVGHNVKKGSGWEEEGGRRRRNKRFLWCLVVLLIIGVAVGVGVAMSKKSASSSTTDPNASNAADSTSASDASVSTVDSSTSPTASDLLTTSTPTATPAATRTSTLPSSTLPASSTPPVNALGSIAAALASPIARPQSLLYPYAVDGVTTSAMVTYTIPASVQTRANGQWQFTESVVLPYPTAVAAGSFTSFLRFRIDPTGTASRKKRSAAGKGMLR
ncbi:hypothetical protein RQP46_002405 [Phenoliferia psychrophenolica]